ncbi:hypothetical protein [Magnetospirillum sp. ME-1]|uniref:hypothetical protein n=1 Tax=Magnetospirillum sp. ME-1 TaxID=1639348 RepID=UPI0011AE9A14|nr:hypothetical protein [Magnetospirillum sp. ME-1]
MGVMNTIGKHMSKLCSASHAMATLDQDLFVIKPPPLFDGLDVIVIRLTDQAAAELLRSARKRGDVIRRASTGQRWMGTAEDVCLISPNPKRRNELMAMAKATFGPMIKL